MKRLLCVFSCVAFCCGAALSQESAGALSTITLKLHPHGGVWDPVSGRFLVSVGQGDPNWSSSIVFVNPDTGQVDDSIPVSDSPGRLAVSGDGQYLYVAINAKGVVRRFHLPSHAPDLDIPVVVPSGSTAIAIAIVPGQPQSVLVANGATLAIYDGAVCRKETAPFSSPAPSLYAQLGKDRVYAYSRGTISVLEISSAGVHIASSTPAFPSTEARVSWSGSLATDDWGFVFDLDALALRGHVSVGPGWYQCISVADPSGTSVLALATGSLDPKPTPLALMRFSATSFLATQTTPLDVSLIERLRGAGNSTELHLWGTDGIAIVYNEAVVFARTSSLTDIPSAPTPVPTVDSSGVIRLHVPATGIVYDPKRNLIWASIDSTGGSIGNSLIAVDPATGRITTAIYLGSDPGALAISDDHERVFATMRGAPLIVPVNLSTRRTESPYPVVLPPQYSGHRLHLPFSIAAIPGEPQAVVAASTAYFSSDSAQLIAAYDPSGPRSQALSGFFNGVINGDAPNSFFAYNGEEVYRLTTDPDGVGLDKRFITPSFSFGSPLAYAEGYLYDANGGMWISDSVTMVSRFISDGAPVVFPARNVVVYVWAEQYEGVTLTAFDLTTFCPVAKLTFRMENSVFGVDYAVAAGANAIALINGAEIDIAPFTALQATPPLTSTLATAAFGVRKSSIPVYAMAPLPDGAGLAVSTPSKAGNLGNRVLIMNPETGDLGFAALAGSEPSLLALSPDGTHAYMWVAGSGQITSVNLSNGTRESLVNADPTGNGLWVRLWDLQVGADGGLAVSYAGGWIAIFDQGVMRSQLDNNADRFCEHGARYQLAFDPTGTKLYGYDQWVSSFGLKRWSVDQAGVTPLSLAERMLTTSYDTVIRYVGGLLYSSNGEVIDPERARDIGRFQYPGLNHETGENHVQDARICPDPDAGRVYFLFDGKILVFDMYTYALLGTMTLPKMDGALYRDFVKADRGVLAFTTNVDELFFVDISAIPVDPFATVPPPVYSLPQTPGVAVMDLTVYDLVYDAQRDRLYGSVPVSEGALASTLVAIDPGRATVTASYAVGPNPRRLAISDDNSALYFTMGMVNSSFIQVGERLRRMDLASGAVSPEFGLAPTPSGAIRSIYDLAVLPGKPHSVAATYSDLGDISLFDDDVKRPVSVRNLHLCQWIEPGATADLLYCSNGAKLSKLSVDWYGVTMIDSSGPDLMGAASTEILYHEGRIYTTNGRIIDPEQYKVIATVPASGQVAVNGDVAYWLSPSPWFESTMVLAAFSTKTFAPLYTRLIKVHTTSVTRLVPCGPGRVAFSAGSQVFVVYPEGGAPSTPSTSVSALTNSASGASGAAEGSLVSLYGLHIAPDGIADAASSLPLPTELDGVSVTVAGRRTPILAVAGANGMGQINFQMPYGLADHGSLPMVVNNGGILSSPVQIKVVPAQPGVFTANGQAVALHADYSLVTADRPASHGETIIVYCTGLGAVNPPVEAGSAAPYAPLALAATPQIAIAGFEVQALYSGLAPGLAGLYQLNVVVPSGAPQGRVQLTVTAGGVSSPPVSLFVQ